MLEADILKSFPEDLLDDFPYNCVRAIGVERTTSFTAFDKLSQCELRLGRGDSLSGNLADDLLPKYPSKDSFALRRGHSALKPAFSITALKSRTIKGCAQQSTR